MVGKGSVNHNSRTFTAENVDKERTYLNIDYCNEPIKKVYHDLFDEALSRYNSAQTRKDRQIPDYYEKIRTGKQEKAPIVTTIELLQQKMLIQIEAVSILITVMYPSEKSITNCSMKRWKNTMQN